MSSQESEAGVPSGMSEVEAGPAPKGNRTLGVILAVALGGLTLAMTGHLLRGNLGTMEEWRLVDLDGKSTSIGDFRGRPIFLNVWATWCGPCVRELPSIEALSARPGLEDVQFLCVSVDDSVQEVKGFLAQRPIGGKVQVLHSNAVTPAVFSTEGIPATFLIAPDGTIVRREIGSMDWDTPDVAAQLRSLSLATTPGAP